MAGKGGAIYSVGYFITCVSMCQCVGVCVCLCVGVSLCVCVFRYNMHSVRKPNKAGAHHCQKTANITRLPASPGPLLRPVCNRTAWCKPTPRPPVAVVAKQQGSSLATTLPHNRQPRSPSAVLLHLPFFITDSEGRPSLLYIRQQRSRSGVALAWSYH